MNEKDFLIDDWIFTIMNSTRNMKVESGLGKEWINKILNDQTELQNKIFSLEEENKRLKSLMDEDSGLKNPDTYKNILYNMLRHGYISNENKQWYNEITLSVDNYPLWGNELDIIQNLYYELQKNDPRYIGVDNISKTVTNESRWL